MRILVTGAAGFIGSHVAEAYHQQGHEVVGLDNLRTGQQENLSSSIRLEVMDVCDHAALERIFRDFRPEVVSHHAAQVNLRISWQQPLLDAQLNILGSLSVLRIAVRLQTQKVIYSSSGGAIYGEPETLPVREDHRRRPHSNYGVSKYAVELYLESFHAASALPYIILRYPNVYGPRQDPGGEAGVVAIFASQLLRGEQPRIFGDGSKTRDYVYIDDIVAANLGALVYDGCEVFNLGWGREVTDLEVFETVREAVGCSVEPLFVEKRPGEIDHISLDASHARNTLGWRPQIHLQEGVQRTVSYWKQKLRAT